MRVDSDEVFKVISWVNLVSSFPRDCERALTWSETEVSSLIDALGEEDVLTACRLALSALNLSW